jgi:hypothetical protein
MALQAAAPGGFYQKPATFNEPSTRVLIAHDIPEILLEVRGKYRIFDPKSQEHMSTRFIGKKQKLEALPLGLKWGEEFPDVHQLAIYPAESTTQILLNGIEYPGHIYIYDIGGALSIVNELETEELLHHALPERANEKAIAPELLAAMAIATRTNLYYDQTHPRNRFWDVAADMLQYHGKLNAPASPQWRRAIDETRYMVMSSNDSKKVETFPIDWHPDEKAIKLAEQGNHAAQILIKAFPGMSIKIAHQPSLYAK